MTDIDGKFSHAPSHVLRPLVLPGGPYEQTNAEAYRQAILERLNRPTQKADIELFPPIDLSFDVRVRVIYRWRSKRHLMRWIKHHTMKVQPCHVR